VTKKDVLALIPARGGSKSVPRKNLLPVAGRPLIAYSIMHAKACQSITRIIVSTDDDEIAEVSRSYGAEVPFKRPADAASDTATDFQVFHHALTWLAEHEAYVPELVVHLRPTGPVRETALIERAVQLMLGSPEADALRSVGTAHVRDHRNSAGFGDGGGVLGTQQPRPARDQHDAPRQIEGRRPRGRGGHDGCLCSPGLSDDDASPATQAFTAASSAGI
jgi:N-acylneuraminate cytidylyltransferase